MSLAAGGDDEASADLRQQCFRGGQRCAAVFPALLPNEPQSRVLEQKSDKAQFGSMPSLPASFDDADISLNFISTCREVRTWEKSDGNRPL